MRRAAFRFAVAALFACLTRTAWGADAAATKSQVDRYSKAESLCRSGDYAGGMKLLEELYRETGKAVLIRNQGRCLEDNGRLVHAMNRFKAYLATGDSAHRGDAERRLSMLEQRAHLDAQQACLAGDYQAGVQRFGEIYAETSRAVYLHAQARCYDQNRQYERAVDGYREYLRSAVVPDEERGLVTARVQSLETFLKTGAAARAAADPALPGAAAASRAAPPAPAAAEVAGPRTTRAADEGSSTGRYAGIAGAVAGATVVTAGIVLGIMANQSESSIEQAGRQGALYDPDEYASGQRAATLATVALVTGPILVAAGITTYLLSRPRDASPTAISNLQIAPVYHGDGGGAVMSVRF